ncbi:unnamed protein product [Cyprideis torosa]|uniref:Uncharacterized protein n=1 Tax=Cyprideis torosa TaxID=163714 RepID=A0A7R8W1X4_9CRUS|nr:unnamed protein product [Cyprideis torosa]CAG0879192.1 unnamed protein product [Cyprideis torosa]
MYTESKYDMNSRGLLSSYGSSRGGAYCEGPIDGSLYARISKPPRREASPAYLMNGGIPRGSSEPNDMHGSRSGNLDSLLDGLLNNVSNIPDLKPSQRGDVDLDRLARDFSHLGPSATGGQSRGIVGPSLSRSATVPGRPSAKDSTVSCVSLDPTSSVHSSPNASKCDSSSTLFYSSPKINLSSPYTSAPFHGGGASSGANSTFYSSSYGTTPQQPQRRGSGRQQGALGLSTSLGSAPRGDDWVSRIMQGADEELDSLSFSSPVASAAPPPPKRKDSKMFAIAGLWEPSAYGTTSRSRQQSGSYSDGEQEPYSWLQRQQMKLIQRREGRYRLERSPQEQKLISELQMFHTRRGMGHERPLDDLDQPSPTPSGMSLARSASTPSANVNRNYNLPSSSGMTAGPISNSNPRIPNHYAFSEDHQKSVQEPLNVMVDSQPQGTRDRLDDRGGGYSPLVRSDGEGSLLQMSSGTTEKDDTIGPPSVSSSMRTPIPVTEEVIVQQTVAPGFSTEPRLPPRSPTTNRRQLSSQSFSRPSDAKRNLNKPSPGGGLVGMNSSYMSSDGTPSPSHYDREPSPSQYYQSQSSIVSLLEPDVIETPLFIQDTQHLWYKRDISRDEAINQLRQMPPGAFIIRDSSSFAGSYGLALRVAPHHLPPNLTAHRTNDSELVRHFLIEAHPNGVRIKGDRREPLFTSLSALVYQHTLTPISLPCKLDLNAIAPSKSTLEANQLLEHGAACKVVYLYAHNSDALMGEAAVRAAVLRLFSSTVEPVVIDFKVSGRGITLTDNLHRQFFRKYYPLKSISFCGIDPDHRKWLLKEEKHESYKTIFGFTALHPTPGVLTNQVHIFADYDPTQPASVIVDFVKIIMKNNGIRF